MISVIMSTYKEPLDYIEKSIASILRQTYKDLEFIIIIDEPNNGELVAYIKQIADNDKRVKYYINEKNCGLTESLNRAVSVSTGEYIARMDADDIAELDRLEVQQKFLLENGLDLVGCNIRNIDENGNLTNDSRTDYPTSDQAIKDYLGTNNAIPHPTWFAKREVYEENQYIDFPACEDYAFLTAIALRGKKLGNVQKAKLKYRINNSGISSCKKVMQKTSLFFIRRNYNEGRISTLREFKIFYGSRKGLKKQKALTLYYTRSARLKEYYRNKNILNFVLLGALTFLTSTEGRNVIANILKEKMLKKKYGSKY